MSAALEEIEAKLKSHFEGLSAHKRQIKQPVFALEHHLSPPEVAEMRKLLYASLRQRAMLPTFKHCWIVHAAEHGYTFQGLEFWQSFAELTPHWEYLGDRATLRNWFAQFAKQYEGVHPVGRWGTHYTYIAWPITHALLPSDLQVHLAHTLYNARYRLDEMISLKPEAVGKMIARQAEWPSTRFKRFLEQHDLVGRVVRALLEGEPEETVIYRPTLKRITADLDSKHDARIWLKDARRQYERFRAKLAASNTQYLLNPLAQTLAQAAHAETDSEGILLAPRLQLRRTVANQWQAYVLIPSFQALVNAKPKLREHLSRVRFRVAAHGNAQFPGLSLVSGRPVPKRLSQWPAERTPLLQFTAAEKFFDNIVDAECQLMPAKLWVFQCLDDGSALHIQGQHMRAEQTYIVVARNAQQLAGIGEPVALQCEGVTAIRLQLPAVTSAQMAQALTQANIGLHRNVQIEPVGLRPRQWSDEGVGEWLSTETPLFSLRCDHEFHGYQVDVTGSSGQFVPRNTDGASTLIALRGLPVGRHEVAIAAVMVNDGALGIHRKTVAQVTLTVFVRHPTTWSPHLQLPSAMVVDTDPAIPTLDDFLARRLELHAQGDESRTAECSIVLVNPVTSEETALQILKHALPITKPQWSEALAAFLKKSDEVQFFNSSRAFLSVQADDLGERRISLAYEPEPVRWALRKTKPPSLFLINEGVSDPIAIAHYPFDHPLRPQAVQEEAACKGLNVEGVGGLYLASYGQEVVHVVVAPAERAYGLFSLGANIDRSEFSSGISVEQLLQSLTIWHGARPSSHMAEIKQHSVTAALRAQLYARVCGDPWSHFENEVTSKPLDERSWTQLENAVHHPPSFAISLTKAWREQGHTSGFNIQKRFGEIAHSFHLASQSGELDAAWLLASNPAAFPLDTPLRDHLAHRLFPVLLKGARLLWLCQDLERGRAS